MRSTLFAVVAIFSLSTAIVAQRNRQPQVSQEALKVMQTHEVMAPVERVFPTVVSAVTDENYKIDSAARDAGLITATENTQSKMGGLGLTTKQNTIRLSISVIATPAGGTRIRINAIDNYVYTYYGKVYRNENQPVTTEAVYRDLFAAIDAALT